MLLERATTIADQEEEEARHGAGPQHTPPPVKATSAATLGWNHSASRRVSRRPRSTSA
jgi:hypothetical protein